MKHLLLTLSFLYAVTSTGLAQSQIPSTIFIIDAQSNTQVQATSEASNLFKTAFVNLVTNTTTAKLQAVAKFGPGKRSIIITQADPTTNGDAYQLSLQRIFLGTTNVVYTFMYNVDQNKLYFYDSNSQNWLDQVVQGNNVLNLDNCHSYGAFNQLNVQAPVQQGNVAMTDNADTAPIDTSVSVGVAPPALPDYEQPENPEEGYLWQPGYWAYSLNSRDYYWVPGVWTAPPTVGLLWTPPYWGFDGGLYVFHSGYWGNNIGFYGGIDYGYGYGGIGFVGGEWREGHFRYNTAVLRVSPRFHYIYEDRAVVHARSLNRYSFNGRGGYMVRPNPHEMAAMHERHIMATPEQIRNQRVAREDKTQFASHSGGRPGNLATAKAPDRVLNNNENVRQNGTNAPATSRMGGSPAVNGARQDNISPRAAGTMPTRPANNVSGVAAPTNVPGGRLGATQGAAPQANTQGGRPAGNGVTPGTSPTGAPMVQGARPNGAPVGGGGTRQGMPGNKPKTDPKLAKPSKTVQPDKKP